MESGVRENTEAEGLCVLLVKCLGVICLCVDNSVAPFKTVSRGRGVQDIYLVSKVFHTERIQDFVVIVRTGGREGVERRASVGVLQTRLAAAACGHLAELRVRR